MKISEIINWIIGAVDKIEQTMISTETGIKRKIAKTRKEILNFFLVSLSYFLGLVMMVTGIVLFFSRFFSLDLVLIFGGATILYIIFLFKMLKRRR